MTRSMMKEGQPAETHSVLAYPFNSDSEPLLNQELKRSGTHLCPALTDVSIRSVPVAWSHFSASNLQRLVFSEYPLDYQLLMRTLHGILSNSKDTLETLSLKWTIGVEVEWADTRLLLKRLTLPRVKDLDIGYMHAQETCQNFQMFDFPALRSLTLRGLDDYRVDSSVIFIDMIKYLPVEQFDKLILISIVFPLGDFPDHDLVKNGSIAEESLPPLLRLVRRLVLLRNLVLYPSSHVLLKYMNYAKEDSINMAGLKKLSMREETDDPEIGILPFLRERVEIGTVDGEYVVPVMEEMRIGMHLSIGKEYLKVAEHTKWHLRRLPPSRN
ncbi:hypothetical protein IW261DRAFT_1631977 [Armillaria novae-zelandiae]|uniref:Uncharacterized protein n=1 Tax=Armillaria novae-zelandiae TaxID=153914 RepID=A0AA39P5Q0_9AGAR|nr:hypothetical protein IW261DRAFT_1631977 [Armillaria novae-zelandiae]